MNCTHAEVAGLKPPPHDLYRLFHFIFSAWQDVHVSWFLFVLTTNQSVLQSDASAPSVDTAAVVVITPPPLFLFNFTLFTYFSSKVVKFEYIESRKVESAYKIQPCVTLFLIIESNYPRVSKILPDKIQRTWALCHQWSLHPCQKQWKNEWL